MARGVVLVSLLLLFLSSCLAQPVYIDPGDDINLAAQTNPAGTTFVLRPGIHRNQRITPRQDQVFSGEEGAVLNGAAVVEGWNYTDGYWVANFTLTPGTLPSNLPGCVVGIRCNHPEQLFINDTQLLHVAALANMNQSSFFLDYTAKLIYIGVNPEGSVVEISTTSAAFVGSTSGKYVTIRGLVIEKYASPAGQAAVGEGLGWVIEDCIIRYNHAYGVIAGNHTQIRRSFIHHNSNWGVFMTSNFVKILASEISHNGLGGYSITANGISCGGVYSSTGNNIYRNNHVHNNGGEGFAMFVSRNAGVNLYELNLIEYNLKAGIYIRDSSNATITRNILRHNGRAISNWMWGAQVTSRTSQSIEVSYNFLTVNAAWGMGVTVVRQLAGDNFDQTLHNAVFNNHITFLAARGQMGALTDNTALPNACLPEANNTFNYNFYHVPDPNFKHVKWEGVDMNLGSWPAVAFPQEVDASVDTQINYDDEYPNVTISLANGTQVDVTGSTYTVPVNAVDDIGIHEVQVLIDGVVVATHHEAPYDVIVPSSSLNAKAYALLSVVVVDVGRKTRTSSAITVYPNAITTGMVTTAIPTTGRPTTGVATTATPTTSSLTTEGTFLTTADGSTVAGTTGTTSQSSDNVRNNDSDSSALAAGAVAGIAVGCAAFLIVLVLVLLLVFRRRKTYSSSESSEDSDTAHLEMNANRRSQHLSGDLESGSAGVYGRAPKAKNISDSVPVTVASGDGNYGPFTRTNSVGDMSDTKAVAKKHSKVAALPKGTSWEIPASELEFYEKVGAGSYGEVFRGQWRQTDVAIKKLKTSTDITPKALKEFYEELNVIKGLRPHQNVVLFYGVCTSSSSTTLCLIFEFLAMGSLTNYLKTHALARPEIIRVIKGIAAGINHLHQENIVHRDIAARNVLLQITDNKIIAKITDFGMSRVTVDAGSNETASNVGPLKWMSPEALRLKQYSTKSDVWSFAVCVWEILNNSEPFPDLDAFQAAAKVAYEGMRLPLPDEEKWPVINNLMQKCFSEDSDMRPNMSKVCQQLDLEK